MSETNVADLPAATCDTEFALTAEFAVTQGGVTKRVSATLAPKGGEGATSTGAWTPLLAAASDGERRVLRVADWIGGSGTKPGAGYLGTAGVVSAVAEALDIRGAAGAAGAAGLAGSAGTAAYGDPVSLTDAATVALDASAGTIFSLTATGTVGKSRQLNKPNGVPAGKAQSLVLFFKQDATGGRALTFASGISPAIGVDTSPDAVTRLVLTTLDGGTTWSVEGGGVVTGPFAHVVTGPTSIAFAASAIRVIPLGVKGAPALGDVWPSVAMPWPGTVLGIRPTLRGTGTLGVTGTLSVNGTNVAGLVAQAYGAGTARKDAVSTDPSHNFVAGDVLNFTHTAAPGGALTDVILAVEVVQR